MHSPSEGGVFKDGKICWKIGRKNIENARFEVEGKPVPEEAVAPFLPLLGFAIGKEVCEMLEQDEKGLLNQMFTNGKRSPELDKRIIWIDRNAGYKISKAD